MVVVPSGYEVGELANKHFFASLCVRHNLVSARFVREATPLTDRDSGRETFLFEFALTGAGVRNYGSILTFSLIPYLHTPYFLIPTPQLPRIPPPYIILSTPEEMGGGDQESSLGSSKDQWKQDIWELRGIKGSRAQGESIGDIGTWCSRRLCVGIALGGYVAKYRPGNGGCNVVGVGDIDTWCDPHQVSMTPNIRTYMYLLCG
eukprot:sb/3470529/